MPPLKHDSACCCQWWSGSRSYRDHQVPCNVDTDHAISPSSTSSCHKAPHGGGCRQAIVRNSTGSPLAQAVTLRRIPTSMEQGNLNSQDVYGHRTAISSQGDRAAGPVCAPAGRRIRSSPRRLGGVKMPSLCSFASRSEQSVVMLTRVP